VLVCVCVRVRVKQHGQVIKALSCQMVSTSLVLKKFRFSVQLQLLQDFMSKKITHIAPVYLAIE